MELHQLRYFVAIVEHGSFTAAAEQVHVTQSGVSAQIGKLEHELGLRLLERGARPVRPTASGEAVLPLARAVLEGVTEIAEVADQLAGVVRGRVSLGMVRGCTIPPFLDAVAGFRREHPGVDLSLVEEDSDVLQRWVLSGEVDLGLVAWAGEVAGGLDATIVVDEPVAVVMPAEHRLATRRTPPRWADLQAESVLSLTPGTGLRAAVDASCAAAGARLDIDLEASSPETLVGLVRRGAGVALLSESMAAGADGLVARRLAGAASTARLGIVRRAGRPSPAARVLDEALVAALTGRRA